METITSRDNERVKHACKVAASAAYRAETGLFFAEGARLCLDLAATLRPTVAFLTEKLLAAHPEAEGIADECWLVQPHVAEKLSETKNSQGLFCLFPLPQSGLDGLNASQGLVLCEDIQDPTNVGAIIRSAAAFGYGGVVLAGSCADAFSPRALRASVGAAARIPVIKAADITTATGSLQQKGIPLVAAALQNAGPLAQAQVKAPFCLMIGNEGRGLSQAALAAADSAVYIPMQSGVESLNAAVAAGVLLYGLKGSGPADG